MFFFFHKYMKILNYAPVCLIIYDFKPQIMLSLCYFQATEFSYVQHQCDCEM